jgi:DNA mismatch endonuclease (patch repair protein)
LLRDAGWTVVRVWEHEDPVEAAITVTEAVADARGRIESRPSQ